MTEYVNELMDEYSEDESSGRIIFPLYNRQNFNYWKVVNKTLTYGKKPYAENY